MLTCRVMSKVESEGGGIEFRWVFLDNIPISNWQDIGPGYFADPDTVGYGLQVRARNINTSVQPDPEDERGLIVTDMVLVDRERRLYVDRKFLLSLKHGKKLKELSRLGCVSMQARRVI